MRMSDLILQKRGGKTLSSEEIYWMIDGYTKGEIPDYQMSAMLMAICFQGMDERETLDLTMAMLYTGDVLDLSTVPGLHADKHSTGGVGDKTSLVLCPMLAACGVKIGKMSGRGLGHTGGTLDKLESFEGFSVEMSGEKFIENVNSVGFAIAGQTDRLCPADRKLYALRDVTGTVSSLPLIVASIMSKKLAGGADVIVLDVKTGSGAFMQSVGEAFELAGSMVKVGRAAGRKIAAVVTDMDEPLGCAVGNALEVREAIDTLRGAGPADLMELCLTLGSEILTAGGIASGREQAREMLTQTITTGTALQRFSRFVSAQGGDGVAVYDTSRLPTAPVQWEVKSELEGYLTHIDALAVGNICTALGGGRVTKESRIDRSVGLVLKKKVGDAVTAGEPLAIIHAANAKAARQAAEDYLSCCRFSQRVCRREPFIKGIVR